MMDPLVFLFFLTILFFFLLLLRAAAAAAAAALPLLSWKTKRNGSRWNTLVGRKLPMISDVAPVLDMLAPRVRVILREVGGAALPLAGEESGRSMSIGVDAIMEEGQ